MWIGLCILVVGFTHGLASGQDLFQENQQWTTQADFHRAMAEMRLAYSTQLDQIKAEFGREIQSVRDDLKAEKEANHWNKAQIERLQLKVVQLEETQTTCGCNDADDSKVAVEDGVKGIQTGFLGSKGRIVQNMDGNQGSRSKRFVLGGKALPTIVAFSVAVSSPAIGENLGAHQIVPFDKVITNLGSMFDTRLSVFTAPVSGWYVFSVTLMSRPNETQEVELVNNNAYVFRCYSTGNEYNTASTTMVVRVEEGNEVWVRISSGLSPNVHGYDHTTFSGWLLYSD